ncbi:MAG: Efflux transporter, RND family, MFP subunit [Candidatus Kaiserbacteria bacterium GW2011_GWB1_52_6]|uniref:Efflux transporter, RND family, MFP subunit n=2 Tax=Candidatus Kaiseribacteriota TaxID=1752734 RepID=A0A0G1XAE4_9BACT|nr:MAG: Efflux transporter, RND family, MFP subunit [Candidatus Kaiserbacteria bacterium GW2011_GWA2_52_12]KKW27805.1 MAG: Efflux transporter, RND family, MFP subunit [Candidatus Kaiserbacteria bacterium GW2011_GWB1_52_6]
MFSGINNLYTLISHNIAHWYRAIKKYAVAHKFVSAVIALVIIGGGWWTYGHVTAASAGTRYVLGTVEKGTVIASVSASGQVSTTNQVDIKPKASGDVTWVGVKAGDVVRAGQALAQIDSTDAKQAIADAEQSLTQAKLQFQKDSAQAPIDYQKSLEALDDAKTNLSTTYNDTYNTLSNAYLDLPTAVTGMQNILYGYDISGKSNSQWNIDAFKNSASKDNTTIRTFADIAERDYRIARAKYDQAVLDFKALSRSSSTDAQEGLLTSSVDTTTAIAQALQSELNLLDAVVDDTTTHGFTVSSTITTMRTNARGYLSTTNSNLSALLNQQKSLDAAKKTIRDDERTIEIYKIGNATGDNPISLQSSQYSIADQERKLRQLKDNLADYTITAPFAGTLATLSVKRFDTVSTGSSVATLITNQKIAQLSLNEVDATKIKLGDKATLTFDAIDGLTLTGSVIEMDAVGTVSQGVVSYSLKIGFDSGDDRVKPGMTVNASIQTAVKQDVLVVPSSAVKTQNGASYVQVFNPALTDTGSTQGVVSKVPPQQVTVEVGISDDTSMEILSGLSVGQQIVTRTSSGSATTNKPATTNATRGGFGGGGIRL